MDPLPKVMEPPCTPLTKGPRPPRTPLPATPGGVPPLARTPAGAKTPAFHLPATPFLSRLGYGTGVSVYLYQRSPSLGSQRSPWAVKKVNRRHAKSQFGRRLEEEAKILRSLSHPNIIQYKAFSVAEDGVHALMMEHGQQSLFDRIECRADAGEGAYPATTVASTVGWVAGALDYLHTDRLLMHGDLKSGNVLVVGDFRTVKLCDFGVTVALDREGRVKTGAVYVGTEAWSPREVFQEAEITSKADIFAFGLVIFEMLSLHTPHIDKLEVAEESEEEEEDEVGRGEEAFRAALGSRPPLPDSVQLDDSYRQVLEIFFATTDGEASKRPSALEVLQLLEQEEQDDSILCVNMVRGEGQEGDEDDEDDDEEEDPDDSVLCVDIVPAGSLATTTPSAV